MNKKKKIRQMGQSFWAGHCWAHWPDFAFCQGLREKIHNMFIIEQMCYMPEMGEPLAGRSWKHWPDIPLPLPYAKFSLNPAIREFSPQSPENKPLTSPTIFLKNLILPNPAFHLPIPQQQPLNNWCPSSSSALVIGWAHTPKTSSIQKNRDKQQPQFDNNKIL